MAIGAPSLGTALQPTSAGTTRNVPYPAAGVADGDVAVMVMANGSGANNAIKAPNDGSSPWSQTDWTQVAQLANTSNTLAPAAGLWWRLCDGTENGATVTVTSTSVTASFAIMTFPGVDNTTPIDGASTVGFVLDDKTAASTTITWPTITPVTANVTIVYVIAANSTTVTCSPITGFTEAYDRTVASARGWEVCYQQGVTAAAHTYSQTTRWSGSTKDTGVLIALRPDVSVTGTLAATLEGATLASSGTVANPVTGTLAVTLAGATLAASGTETITGTLTATLAGATLAASGTEKMTGTLAATLDGASLAASGTVANPVTGTLAATLQGATLAAVGVAGPADVTGILAATLAGATLAATGGETFTGTMSATLAGATAAATGVVANPITGTLTVTLDGAVLSASGVETVQGSLTATLQGATLAATGVTYEDVTGTLAVTLDGATLDASGEVSVFRNITVTYVEHQRTLEAVEHHRTIDAVEHQAAMTVVDRS